MTTEATRPASRIFHAVTHVWGRPYLDVFLNLCIPNQLGPGNVPALPPGSRYRILTRSSDVEEIDAHPMVHALRDVIAVDIVVIDALDRQGEGPSGTELMIACHQHAIADILEADAAIIMLSADFVLSDHTLAAVVRRHREGYRAVVNTGLRLSAESFVPALQASGLPLAALSSRELVRMAMPHLHPHTRSMFAGSDRFSKSPVAVYWPVGDDGLLARCFHLHPLMVDPMRPVPLHTGTNDGPYLAEACPDFTRVHVVDDSDELQMFEMTTAQRQVVGVTKSGLSSWRAAIVAARCDALQMHFWQHHPIRLHASDYHQGWDRAAATAETFARRVLRERPYAGLADFWFKWNGKLGKGLGAYEKSLRRQRRRIRLAPVQQWAARRVRLIERRRPRLRVKQYQRPVKLLLHRVSKAAGVRAKRIRRRLRLA
jgi:hypothetical protein